MTARAVRSDVWRWVKHFFYGAFAKSWNGAIAGVYGFVGVATGSALDPQKIQAPNWEMILYIFGVSFAISVASTTTIRAFATAAGMTDSAVASPTYTISPGGGGVSATATTVNVGTFNKL